MKRKNKIYFTFAIFLFFVAFSYYSAFYNFAYLSSSQQALSSLATVPAPKPVVSNVRIAYSPSETFGIDATRDKEPFKAIVIHHTAINGLRASVRYGKTWDYSRGGKFGYHFYIGKTGLIVQGAPYDKRTNHIKKPSARERVIKKGIANTNAIGIATTGFGNDTPQQEQAAIQLARALMAHFNIPKSMVFGHGELQSDRHDGIKIARKIRRMPQPVANGDLYKIASLGNYDAGAVNNGQGQGYYNQNSSGDFYSPAPSTSGQGYASNGVPLGASASDVQEPLQMESYGTPGQDGSYVPLDENGNPTDEGADNYDYGDRDIKGDSEKYGFNSPSEEKKDAEWEKEEFDKSVSEGMLDVKDDESGVVDDDSESLGENEDRTVATSTEEDSVAGDAETNSDNESGRDYTGSGRNEDYINKYVEGFSLGTDIAQHNLDLKFSHRAEEESDSVSYGALNTTYKDNNFSVSDIFSSNSSVNDKSVEVPDVIDRYNPADPNSLWRGWTKDGRRVADDARYRGNYTPVRIDDPNRLAGKYKDDKESVRTNNKKPGFLKRIMIAASNAGQQAREWFISKLDWF